MGLSVYFLAFFLLLSSNIWPQSASRSSPTKPLQENLFPRDVLTYFSGAWTGKGKFAMGEVIASDITFTTDLQNQCLVMREREKPPNTFQFIGLWSMDSVSGNLVTLLASNHNSGARVFRSHGWQGSKIVLQSGPELRASWALERFTFGRKSSAVFDATYEFSKDDGRTWQVGDRQVYTKVSSR
jgi:hypothetical protein